jgi:hypothetical protein
VLLRSRLPLPSQWHAATSIGQRPRELLLPHWGMAAEPP